MPGSFYLNKWYLDAVDPDGRALIGYSGEIGWNKWRIPYSSLLTALPEQPIAFNSRWRHNHWPEDNDASLHWTDPGLHISAQWTRQTPAIRELLFENASGKVEWDCRFPCAETAIQLGDAQVLRGFGYAERLCLTLPPWQLPLHTLRWGRFCAAEHSLVWIEWQHETTPRRWLYLDGRRLDDTGAIIGENAVQAPAAGLHLELQPFRTLESEKKLQKISAELLHWIPGFDRLAPLHFLMADEHKWLSRGVLRLPGQPECAGWVIHVRGDFSNNT